MGINYVSIRYGTIGNEVWNNKAWCMIWVKNVDTSFIRGETQSIFIILALGGVFYYMSTSS